MKETQKMYYWKCPECETEQKVISSYFVVDGEASEKCCKCGKRIQCSITSDKKKDGGVVAYTKE